MDTYRKIHLTCKNMNKRTRRRILKAFVFTMSMYRAESWPLKGSLTKTMLNELSRFLKNCSAKAKSKEPEYIPLLARKDIDVMAMARKQKDNTFLNWSCS